MVYWLRVDCERKEGEDTLPFSNILTFSLSHFDSKIFDQFIQNLRIFLNLITI